MSRLLFSREAKPSATTVGVPNIPELNLNFVVMESQRSRAQQTGLSYRIESGSLRNRPLKTADINATITLNA